MPEERIALIVNAGGQSLRMGRVKALLPLPPDSTPLLIHIVRRLSPLVNDRFVVVSNDPLVADTANRLGKMVVVSDRWSEGGALGGVATGLGVCAGWAMVVACDMPLVEPSIFAKLIDVAQNRPELDAVIPLVAGHAQPFHGLWHARALPGIEARLAQGKLGVQAALSVLEVAWMDEQALGIEPDSLAFYNVNTPQEWTDLLALLEEKKWPIA